MAQDVDLYSQVQVPLLTSGKLIELLERVQAGDQVAKHQIMLANIGLVRKSAIYHVRHTAPVGTDVRDLFQEGLVGLNRAIDKFDFRKGYAFSTYAVTWITQAITSYIHSNSALITPPECEHGARLVAQIRADFQARNGRQPTSEEICQIGRITPAAFARYSALPVTVSTHRPLIAQDGTETTIEDTVLAARINADQTEALDAVLDLCMAIEDLHLTPIERQVMEMRFGFGDYMPHSIAQIAKVVNRRGRDVEVLLNQIVTRLRNHERLAVHPN
jgi:RNA polymerase primary sigma factor